MTYILHSSTCSSISIFSLDVNEGPELLRFVHARCSLRRHLQHITQAQTFALASHVMVTPMLFALLRCFELTCPGGGKSHHRMNEEMN